MSYGAFYQAMPEESDLLRFVKEDRAAELLLEHLWCHGSRPLDLREMDEDEMEEVLNDAVEILGFDDRVHVSRAFSKLESEIDRACEMFPGLMDRTVLVEQVHTELEANLGAKFECDGLPDPRGLIRTFLFGEAPLNPAYGWPNDGLSWIASPTVELGSRVLGEVDPEVLYRGAGMGRDFRDDFRALRGLFQEAAALGEAILVHGE
jgi:hypothetical protein